MKSKILLLLSCILAGCSKNPTQHELEPQVGIISGYQTDPSSDIARSTVYLKIEYFIGEKKVDGGACTGIIINPTTILTAAHCVYNEKKVYDRIEVSVQFNTNLKYENPRIGKATDVLTHLSYSTFDPIYFDNFDVAIVKLADPVPAPFKPVPILYDLSGLEINTPIIVAGYGVSVRPDTTPGFLKHTELLIMGIKHDRVELRGSIDNNVCFGDSGGPAFVRINGVLHVLGTSTKVGIVDGVSCAGTTTYTRLHFVKNFIDRFMQK